MRRPGSAAGRVVPWTSTDRTRDVAVPGRIRTSWPTATVPLHVVPVTTVPAPAILKTRSIGMRNRSSVDRSAARPAARASTSLRWSSPCPVSAEQRTGASHATAEPRSRDSTSLSTRSSHSSSARSALVIATTPLRTPRNSRIARCSAVWSITPSSAATTMRATSIPVAPATMLRTKSSWPGTSTMLAWRPSGRSRRANPRSMVMPRRFSSSQRSVSMPVSAFTSAVFPWSTCPAVPMTTCRVMPALATWPGP